jgi:alkylation response protein AidB-like acyl-CoA dehydrogenase
MENLSAPDRKWFRALEEVVDEVVEPEAGVADRMATFPRSSLTALREIGAFGVQIAGRFGGLGLGDVAACLVVERIAQSCASTAAILMFHYQVVRRTLRHGAAPYRDDDLRGFASGALIGCSAWTEAGSGPDKSSLSTRLVVVEDGLLLEGEKTFCTGVTTAGVVHVLADLRQDGVSQGSTFVRVDAKESGLRVSQPYPLLGLRASGTASVAFDGVRLSRDDLVGPPGSGALLMGLNHEVCLNPGLLALGTATSAFCSTVAMLSEAGAGAGRLESGTAQDALVTSLVQLESAYCLAAHAVTRPASAAARIASGKFKFQATAVAEELTDRLLPVAGSRGFLSTFPLERKLRDARAASLMGPSNDLIKKRIMGTLLHSAATPEVVRHEN